MKNLPIKISLYINYFIFAILLNSIGIVVLKSQLVYGVSKIDASTLELFKDLPIAIFSFAVASFLPRIGFKKSMLIALAIVFFACLGMFLGNSFWSAKLLFSAIGVAFALIKVSVYSVIGLITDSPKEHNSLMSSIEGLFMVGIAVAYFLFPAFNSSNNPDQWLRVYLLLAGLSFLSFLFLAMAKFEETPIEDSSIKADFVQMGSLIVKMLVIVFLICAFLFVTIEQGIMTWLPTFNSEVLKLPESIGVMMASILAISLAVGRLAAGFLTKKYSWFTVLFACIIIAMALVVFLLPKAAGLETKTISNLKDIPFLGYAFPLIGIFIAPIYPLINSTVLSALPKKLHSPMTGLIVIFSALGGTLGSILIGWLFENVGGEKAFYFTLIPMVGLLIGLYFLKKLTEKEIV